MRASVAAAWPAFVSAYEGRCWWMYLDTKKLVTTGVGFLIDSIAAAQALPWIRASDRQPATEEEVASEWRRVKSLTGLAHRGGFAYQESARLRLPEADIDRLLMTKSGQFWDVLASQLSDVEQWPADAQLALMDMGWHMGPRFLGPGWPNFTKAAKAGNLEGMAKYCATSANSPRDARHKRLFRNAAKVGRLNPDTLWDADPLPAEHMPEDVPESETPIDPQSDPIGAKIAQLTVKHSSTYDAEYVTFDGAKLTPLDLEIVLRCAAEVGWGSVSFSQGGLSTGVLASAKTHFGLGVADISTRGHSTAQVWMFCAAMIRSGIVAFPRGYTTDSFQNNKHIHAGSRESSRHAHPQLKAQIKEFLRGGDGLVGNRSYYGPSVRLSYWKDSPYNPTNITTDTGTYYVNTETDPLLGLDVDRKIIKSRPRGFEVVAAKRVQRWGRPNVVTDAGVFYALDLLSLTKPEEIAP